MNGFFNVDGMMQVIKIVLVMIDVVKDVFIMNICRRMIFQLLKICVDIELKCFQFDGVFYIKVSQLQLLFEYFYFYFFWFML